MDELEKIIIKQIKLNKLENLSYDLIINQLCVLNNKPFDLIKTTIDKLISQKKLKIKCKPNLDTNNESKINRIHNAQGDIPKSPYSNRQSNIDLAYDILNKKDKKSNSKITRIQGKIQGTSKGYAFLIPDDITLDDVFISEKDLNGAMHNDRVVVSVKNTGGRKLEGKVIQVIERGAQRIVGLLRIIKKLAYVVPDDVKFGKNISIPLNKLFNANDGDKVVAKITRYYNTKRNPDGEIVEILGKPNQIDTEVLAVIRSYNMYENFPKKVLESAKLLPDIINKEDYAYRLDYTNNICFTIDGEDTRDIDDAISLDLKDNGNRVLGVHIADVGEYVKKDNIFDKEAFKRGTSVYFPNMVLPMLPRELSNGICSLNERVDRLAISCFMEFDKNANVVDYKICESIINSKKRFTYTEVQSIFDGDRNEKPELIEKLLLMKDLAKQLEEKRNIRGAIEFNIPEVQVYLNELGDVLNLKRREHNESHKLIESFMIIANETIATHFLSKNIPFVYRIHEKPDSEKISNLISMINNFLIKHTLNSEEVTPKDIQILLNEIKDENVEYIINKIALRCMKKAKYSPECIGHFGLASPKYCHFTSPIRRYPDLTIHRIIKEYLHNQINEKEKLALKEFVNLSSIQSSETEKSAESVERDVDDLYRAFYMTHHVGEDFDGVVSSVTSFGIFVELDNTVEGMIRIEDLPQDQYEFLEDRFTMKGYSHKFTIGDKIKVKCVRADILSREVDFVPINNAEQKN